MSEEQTDTITFERYLLLMSTQALLAMGAPHPMTGQSEVNPKAARYTIDTLLMLEAKTQGNLTDHEQNLFNQILHELRTRYAEVFADAVIDETEEADGCGR